MKHLVPMYIQVEAKSKAKAEEIVQAAFFKDWMGRGGADFKDLESGGKVKAWFTSKQYFRSQKENSTFSY